MMQYSKDIFNELSTEFMELLPNILASLIVLTIGYVIARLVKYLIIRLSNLLEKIAKKRLLYLDFKQAGYYLSIAFFWLIIFSSILIITDLLGLSVLTKWFQSIIHYIPNIFAAILIVFASIILGNLVSNLLVSVSKHTGLKYDSSLVKIIRFLILAMAIIIALDQIGIEISLLKDIIDIVLAAILFGAALAFGLGARTSISNILACYYVRRSYKRGDTIKIGDTKGKIIKIDTTNVVLLNDEGRVIIPAKEFSKTKSILIIND